jgi:hypothetical protein
MCWPSHLLCDVSYHVPLRLCHGPPIFGVILPCAASDVSWDLSTRIRWRSNYCASRGHSRSCASTPTRWTSTPSSSATSRQGLTLVHLSAQRKHFLWDSLGALISPSLLDRGTRGGVTKTAWVELKSGRVYAPASRSSATTRTPRSR